VTFSDWKQRTRAWFRIAWRHVVAGFVCVVAALVALRVFASADKDSLERDIALVVIGGLISVGVAAIYRAATLVAEYRQGAYTERAKAVQLVLSEARTVKASWFGSLLGRLTAVGVSPASMDPHTAVVDRLTPSLLLRTWENRVWIGRSGERAVYQFIDGLKAVHEHHGNWSTSPSDERARLEQAVGEPFGTLERTLMLDLGYWAD
jgi:hypothetical protein